MTQKTDQDVILLADDTYRYQMLSRLKMDCDYYLGHGGGNVLSLWAKNAADQINFMKKLWHSFPDVGEPEWLKWNELLEYEQKMKCVKPNNKNWS